MSEIFHKSVYTSRGSGYKYRTLSTNTGDKKKRSSKEEETNFDRKFKELRREIATRIDKEIYETQNAREKIKNKLEKIQSKIDSMLELQNTMHSLRSDLHVAEQNLADIISRVYVIESVTNSEVSTLRSPKFSLEFGNQPITEDKNELSSIVTHI